MSKRYGVYLPDRTAEELSIIAKEFGVTVPHVIQLSCALVDKQKLFSILRLK